ncbi:hypothetical protein BCR44DRAFT_1405524, partial [Catenaria anguillulae PL171]
MARRSKRSLQVSRQQQKIKDGLRDASTQYGNENGQDYDLRALAGLPPKQEHRSRKARQPPPVKRPLNLVLSSDDEQVADPVAQPGPTKRPRPKQGMTYDENQMPASNGNALLPDSRTNAAPRKTAPPQVLSQLQRKEPRAPTTSKLDAHPLQSTPTCAPTDGAQAPAPQQSPSSPPASGGSANSKANKSPRNPTSGASQPSAPSCRCASIPPGRSQPCGWCSGYGRIAHTTRVTESEKEELLKVSAAARKYMPTSGKAAGKIKATHAMRAMAVHLYIQFRLRGHGKDWSRKQAATEVYQTSRRAGRVKKEYASLVATGTLIKFKSGGDRSKQSWLLTQDDKLQQMREWLESQPRGKVTAASFASWVTSAILKPIADAEAAAATSAAPKRNWAVLTERLAKRYLRLLGWVYAKDAKGAYTDGKCRDDVLAEREAFIAAMDGLAPRMRTTVEELVHQDSLDDALKRLVVPVYHDECTFMANDCQTVYWKPRWTHPLKKKSRGRGIMVSSFVCECHGELTVGNSTTIGGARVLFEYGARAQGYWTGTDLYHQVLDRLIPVFNAMHGNGPNGRPCQGLFVFDNATGHKIFAPDALVAKKL